MKRPKKWPGGFQDAIYSLDVARFAREQLGFVPDETQERVLNSRANRGILNCTRQWGKSTVTAVMALHRACFKEESLTIAVSPSGRQTGEFMRKAKGFARRLGIEARGDGDNEISMLFPNRSRIVGLPGSEATVRGFSAVSLLLVDEASCVQDELYKAVRPFLAVGGGDLWLISTPRGKRGFFWDEWSSNSGRWTKFKVPVTECPRISREFAEEERAAMGERWFQQEYLCEFVDTGSSLFDRDLVERAFSKDVKPLFG